MDFYFCPLSVISWNSFEDNIVPLTQSPVKMGEVSHLCSTNTCRNEAGRLFDPNCRGLYRETLPQKAKTITKTDSLFLERSNLSQENKRHSCSSLSVALQQSPILCLQSPVFKLDILWKVFWVHLLVVSCHVYERLNPKKLADFRSILKKHRKYCVGRYSVVMDRASQVTLFLHCCYLKPLCTFAWTLRKL